MSSRGPWEAELAGCWGGDFLGALAYCFSLVFFFPGDKKAELLKAFEQRRVKMARWRTWLRFGLAPTA